MPDNLSASAQAALAYAKRGWRVVPQVPREKRPSIKDWVNAASTDETQIVTWWSEQPDAGVGVVTGVRSGVVVLDIDPRHDGDKTLASLELLHGPLPQSVECLTGGGGRHIYFTCPEAPRFGWKKDLGGGLELLAEGAKATAPPSIHPNGVEYEWAFGSSPDDLPLAPLPAWLLVAASLPAPPPVKERARKPVRMTAEQSVSVAVETYNRVNAQEWPKKTAGATCPICTHDDGFQALKADPSRWICYCGGHVEGGRKTQTAWSGDVLDVDAWLAGRRGQEGRIEHLRATGYLAEKSHDADMTRNTATCADSNSDSSDIRNAPDPWEEGPPIESYTSKVRITGTPKDTESHLTDMGNSKMLARLHDGELLYAADMERWFRWDGKRWGPATHADMIECAKSVPVERRKLAFAKPNNPIDDTPSKDKAAALRWAHTCESAGKLRACLDVGISEPEFRSRSVEMDTHPMLFTCENGTIDLTTGTIAPHERWHKITKLCPIEYIPEAKCPAWISFLYDVFMGDFDLIDFVHRAVGYSLTGSIKEQKFFVCFESGSNGKSTFFNILSKLLGDHADHAQFDTFLANKRDPAGASPDLAKLRGLRVVTALEAEAGSRLSEPLIKQLTGGDAMSARNLHESLFTFKPHFKLWLAANHKPIIRGSDHGIWRRPMLIPFKARFKETIEPGENEQTTKMVDPDMSQKLEAELPGILAWAVAGCLAWQRKRIGTCEAVMEATKEYRSECDVLGGFLDERTTRAPDLWVSCGELYQAYSEWAKASGEFCLSKTALGKALNERGFRSDRIHGIRAYFGISIVSTL